MPDLVALRDVDYIPIMSNFASTLQKPRRRWFQYSLRTFFVGMFALTLLIAWWSRAAQRQKEAVDVIRSAGGSVRYDFQQRKPFRNESDVPKTLITFFGIDFFHNVVRVDLVRNDGKSSTSTQVALEQLRSFPHLNSLSLERSVLTDEALQIVGNCHELTSLGIGYAKAISDAGLGHLGRLTRLQELWLSDVRIGREGNQALAQLTALRELSLFGCELTNDTLVQIGSMSPLTKLSVGSSKGVTDEGLQALTSLSNLSELDLTSLDQITDEGLGYLEGLTTLTHLNLNGLHRITDKGLEHLAGLTNLTHLELSSMLIRDKGLRSLTSLTNLTDLKLTSCSEIMGEGLKSLATLPKLNHLDLWGLDRVSDEGLKSLAEFKCLTHLSITWPIRATDEGIRQLAGLKNLREFRLAGTWSNTDDELNALTGMTNLTSLSLRGAKAVTDDGLKHLMGLRKLSSLDLTGLRHITDGGLKHLYGLTALTDLRLNDTEITIAGLQQLHTALPSCMIWASVTLPDGTGNPLLKIYGPGAGS